MLAKRSKKRTTDTATIRTWHDQDRPWLLVAEVTSLYGLPRRYLLVKQLANQNQTVISRHRKRSAAVYALEKLGR